ncbi:MAG: (2Fe-2S)-binding protein [Leptospiraceae bacterium]|nr:(2Fe-2S)-binding protein [Leptospiraceae bacterium]MCP5511731.1 (2Fe-2S)-binding protein [Leptospiraceae bacterium]
MRPKNICICRAVSEKTLVDLIHSGVHDLEELRFRSDASMKCGSCYPQVRTIFNREMKIIQSESDKQN